jgi:hypothetical protein
VRPGEIVSQLLEQGERAIRAPEAIHPTPLYEGQRFVKTREEGLGPWTVFAGLGSAGGLGDGVGSAHFSIAPCSREGGVRSWVGDQVGSGLTPAAHFVAGLSGSQRGGGACRSEGGERLLAGEHVPDRLGETAGEVDLRDLAAALTAGTFLELLVALLVERVA